ncbi:MAG: AIM24 family protein [Defluviitaleaceae bacterium]|nr:AIM24 family protein [Defluviitaleaceae bacterium]
MKLKNYLDNPNVEVIEEHGVFKVVKHVKDLSVASGADAVQAYYAEKMNRCKRQLYIELNGTTGVRLVPGAMQMTCGRLEVTTSDSSDFITRAARSFVTGASIIHPRFVGHGIVITEPTYNHKLIMNVGSTPHGLVIRNGLLHAYEDTLKLETVQMNTLTGAIFGGNKGLFCLGLSGTGYCALESVLPMTEVVEVELDGSTELKVDGDQAIMWEKQLHHSVERSTKTLMGSFFSGEGLVHAYRGIGRIWLELTAYDYSMTSTTS